jgi:hypothetical protein
MTAYAVLNDESMRTGDRAQDQRRLLLLRETFLALRREVVDYHRERVQACVTAAVWEIVLPSGDTLVSALSKLGPRYREEAGELRRLLANAPKTFDEHGDAEPGGFAPSTEVYHAPGAGELRDVPALRAAWLLRGLAWSAEHPSWQNETIPLKVRDALGELRDELLAHAYRPEIGSHQRSVLARHATVLPAFDAEDHRHDPMHPGYVRGKSHIPRHAERILRYARPVEGGMKWWARCACGFYHRFQGSQQQREEGRARVHWNGTTNPHAMGNQQGVPTTDRDVPAGVKDQLATHRALGEGDCGCRELRGPGRD